jgi:hypothetical protein
MAGFPVITLRLPQKENDVQTIESKTGELPMTVSLTHTARLALTIGTLAATLSFTDASAASLSDQRSDMFLSSTADLSPVSDQILDENRGGSITPPTLNVSDLNADSHGNKVIGGTTGANVIGENSLSSNQGLVNVIQNSGNNVIIQSSTIVNLTFNK